MHIPQKEVLHLTSYISNHISTKARGLAMTTTYSHSSHSSVLLPCTNQKNFLNDEDAQDALLNLLYNKIAVEHGSARGNYQELFLEFDESRKGILSMKDFRQVLDDLGVPLTEIQTHWLMSRFDCNMDGKLDYIEFTKMLSEWREAGSKGNRRRSSTGLDWEYGQQFGSPFKRADAAREERKKIVISQYEHILRKAHEEGAANEIGVDETIRKLAQLAYEKEGGLKKAFAHWDRDGDNQLSREDLGATFQRLGLDITPAEMTTLIEALDVDGNGEIHYWEFVRSLADYAQNIGKDKIGSKLLNLPEQIEEDVASDVSTGGGDLPNVSTFILEDDESALDDELEEIKGDAKILAQVGEVLHERGLHAHQMIKTLMPDSGGSVDVKGLRTLFAKLGVPISEAHARRFMTKGDLNKTGHLVSWELVRLLASTNKRQE